MKYCLLILFLSVFNYLKAQECKCQDELSFVINYYEENLPGFIDNVNENNQSQYNNFKDELFEQTQNNCENENLCFKILLNYVESFRDNHSSIYVNNSVSINENSDEEVNKFLNSDVYNSREIIDEIQAPSNASLNSIENNYQTADSSYSVSIVKSQNLFRDYAGVILESKSQLWKKGQVKFELKEVGDNTYDMIMYMRNHSLRYYKNVKLVDGILNDTWYNLNLKENKSFNIDTRRDLTFLELDDETNYMYIPTFNGDWFSKLNEFYQKYDVAIQSKPYLIIDVRNNGGGSDTNVRPLLKYIYSKAFLTDDVDIYATKENIRKGQEWYERMKKDTANYSNEILNRVHSEIERMKSVPNKTFIERSKGFLVKLDTILPSPKKVAIITNKYCASSCETLLFWAMESDKTIIVGENSGGYVGYGEIGGVNTPNFNFELGCTMTRYKKQRMYEVIGIPPKYYLNNGEDWVQQTLKLIKE